MFLELARPLTPRSQKPLAERLHPHEILALFLAAVGHDAAHFGRNNAFLAATKHAISSRFPTSSLENYHLEQLKFAMGGGPPKKNGSSGAEGAGGGGPEAGADGGGGGAAAGGGGAAHGGEASRGDLLMACSSLSEEQRAEVRELVDELVLATDMAQHGRYMKLLGELLENGGAGASPADIRRVTLVFMIKMSDLGNVFRPLGRDAQPAFVIGRHYTTERDSAPVQYTGIV